jgi:hypothetical protein
MRRPALGYFPFAFASGPPWRHDEAPVAIGIALYGDS